MNDPLQQGNRTGKKGSAVIFRLIVCAAVLVAGAVAMQRFASLKTPPHAATPKEHALDVEVVPAKPETIRVHLTGFGVAEPLHSLTISSEVSGRILRTHERLRAGEVIDQGELLFEIDPVDYHVALATARAALKERSGALELLKIEFEMDRQRQTTLDRTRDLAQAEFKRIRQLFEQSHVGNRSGVDQAEQTYNSAKDQADKLHMSLALYPLEIRQAEAQVSAAEADLEKAQAQVSRCQVRALFRLRVSEVLAETGEYVSPGKEMVRAADDSIHEIQVSLDSREVAKWLLFNSGDAPEPGWFSRPEPVVCRVSWSDAPDGVTWEGVLNRIVAMDRTSRTTTVAVWVDHTPGSGDGSRQVPLVAGMFCTVEIPGRHLENVVKVPRWAVTTDRTLYLSENDRLRTRTVDWDYSEGENLYLSGGIRPGDLIIVTRLVNPLENTLIRVRSATE